MLDTQNKEVLIAKLKELQACGLTFADCTALFGVDTTGNPHARYAADNLTNDEVEVDDCTVIHPGEDGFFVMAWLWVGNSDIARVSR